jgi:hypothetical protein
MVVTLASSGEGQAPSLGSRLVALARRRRVSEYPLLGSPRESPAEEGRRFEQEWGLFPRSLSRGGRERRDQPLDEVVAAAVKPPQRSKATFRCIAIQVEGGDGMSWSATRVARRVREVAPHVGKTYLKGEGTLEEPEIARFVKPRVFTRLAQKHGLVRRSWAVQPWAKPAILAASIGMGIVASLLGVLAQSAQPASPGLLGEPSFLFFAGAGALVGLVAQQLGASLGSDDHSKTAHTLRGALKQARETRSAAYGSFVEALAARLDIAGAARCVIVDDFDRLDPLTSEVVVTYLTRRAPNLVGFDVWLVFEHSAFSKTTVTWRSQGATRFRQALLDESERRKLADYCGRPERATYSTVRAIRHPEHADEGSLGLLFDEYRARRPRVEDQADELDMLYLLAAASTTEGNRVVTRSEIETFGGGRTRGKARAEVLRKLLPGPPATAERCKSLTRRLVDDGLLRRCLEVEGEGAAMRVRVMREAAHFLADAAPSYGLPDARLTHLFWTLFVYDQTQNEPVRGFWARELAGHLAAEGGEGAVYFTGLVPDEVFEASHFAARACIRACLPSHLPAVLARAEALVDPGTTKGAAKARRLLALAWEAYSITGDESILRLLIALDARLHQADTAKGASDPLERFFLADVDARRLPVARTEAAAALRAYARVRGAWLALALGSFDHGAAPTVAEACAAASDALPDLVEAAIARIRDGSRRLAADFATLSIGLWCLALVVTRSPMTSDTEQLADLLEEVLRVAAELDAERRPNGETEDFLAAGFARELPLVVAVCATLLGSNGASTPHLKTIMDLLEDAMGDWRPLDAERARVLVGRALHQFGLSQSEAHKVAEGDPLELAQRLDVEQRRVRAMWGVLGLDQLATFAELRRAHARFLTIEDDEPSVADAVSTVSGLKEWPGPLDLLVHAVAAVGASSSHEIASALLVHGVDRTLRPDFPPDLSADLCLLALSQAHPYRINLDTILAHVTNSGSVGGGSALEAFLETTADDDLGVRAHWFLNAIGKSEREDLVARVDQLVRERANQIADDSDRAELTYELEVSELARTLRRGADVDVGAKLTEWEDRADSEAYPMLLYVLFGRDDSEDDRIADEAVRVLADVRGHGRSTAYVLLALPLIRHAQRRGEASPRETAVAYLERGLWYWEDKLSVEVNRVAFSALRTYGTSGDNRYAERLAHWDAMQHRRDLAAKLPRLVEQGAYFHLFWHYYDRLAEWGLEADLPAEDLARAFEASSEERRALVEGWLDEGGATPEPFVAGGSARLASRFLLLGHYLFAPPLAGESSLDEKRAQFDELARLRLGRLYKAVTTLQSVPKSIRDILTEHQASLFGASLPGAA